MDPFTKLNVLALIFVSGVTFTLVFIALAPRRENLPLFFPITSFV